MKYPVLFSLILTSSAYSSEGGTSPIFDLSDFLESQTTGLRTNTREIRFHKTPDGQSVSLIDEVDSFGSLMYGDEWVDQIECWYVDVNGEDKNVPCPKGAEYYQKNSAEIIPEVGEENTQGSPLGSTLHKPESSDDYRRLFQGSKERLYYRNCLDCNDYS